MKKNFLILKGPLKQKTLKLKLKIFINNSKKMINVSSVTFSKVSNIERKNIKILKNTTIALIKQALIETSIIIHNKLTINGVGYRVTFTETFNNKLLTLKLGYSHVIYFKIPDNLKIDCLTKTKICVFGSSYKDISQISALIRANKLPEPYKGKGILYENEKINLKEGKKV
jgi:large subunit ribosomal protein L6